MVSAQYSAALLRRHRRRLFWAAFRRLNRARRNFSTGTRKIAFGACLRACFPRLVPQTVEQKKKLVLENRLALWDVIAECEITGSADTSIKNVKPNDIAGIIENTAVSRIFVNGKTAEKYYIRYIEKTVGQKAICLPSTSPANAAWSLDRLINAWQIIK